jgi:hypothetical protein
MGISEFAFLLYMPTFTVETTVTEEPISRVAFPIQSFLSVIVFVGGFIRNIALGTGKSTNYAHPEGGVKEGI